MRGLHKGDPACADRRILFFFLIIDRLHAPVSCQNFFPFSLLPSALTCLVAGASTTAAVSPQNPVFLLYPDAAFPIPPFSWLQKTEPIRVPLCIFIRFIQLPLRFRFPQPLPYPPWYPRLRWFRCPPQFHRPLRFHHLRLQHPFHRWSRRLSDWSR